LHDLGHEIEQLLQRMLVKSERQVSINTGDGPASTWHGPPRTSLSFIFCFGVLSACRMIATTHLPLPPSLKNPAINLGAAGLNRMPIAE
jgi:hypothetical protein